MLVLQQGVQGIMIKKRESTEEELPKEEKLEKQQWPLQVEDDEEEDKVSGMLDSLIDSLPPPLTEGNASARHILLTDSTGFLCQHVLRELLADHDSNTVVVCLFRPSPRFKLEQSHASNPRVIIATEVPVDLDYRQIIHLAAQVDHLKSYAAPKKPNVDFTEDLLRLRLAPVQP